MIWERIGRYKQGQWQIPKNVIHVDANLSPQSIKLDQANESKVVFLHPGTQVFNNMSLILIQPQSELDIGSWYVTYPPHPTYLPTHPELSVLLLFKLDH